jgi:CheY-like chemotaxis protein
MAVILIIDDSPTELHLFQNMLEKNGFDTLVADSGEEGLRQAQAARPDCILMAQAQPGPANIQYSGDHHYQQGPGNGQDLGHAAGRRRVPGEADWGERTCGKDKRGDG